VIRLGDFIEKGDHELSNVEKADKRDLERLSGIVMDLAEVVARLTHEEDMLAIPEGRLEAERLAREARHLTAVAVSASSPVSLLAGRMPVRVAATATLREVARTLEREGVGALIVRGARATAGIVTERDLVRALASGADPDTELVAQWMHRPIVSIGSDETVLDAGRAMATHHVRHLVLTDGDEVTGVVSARDVLSALNKRDQDS
jgi:CBS domain-containing protein